MTINTIETDVREALARKISGTHMGLWLLIPEFQRLNAWGIINNTFNPNGDNEISPRIALQLVNESCLGVNRIRARGSLNNQGFSLCNGLSFLGSDQTVHSLLDAHTVSEYQTFQKQLLQIRCLQNHYDGNNIFALDPHRIVSSTKRISPAKKKTAQAASNKILQTFFCIDTLSGQPLMFLNGSSGKNCTPATISLMEMLEGTGIKKGLFIADKEHFTAEIGEWFCNNGQYEILMPAPNIKKITTMYENLDFSKQWAGYATAETDFKFDKSENNLRLIVQKQGEVENEFNYKGFLTTSKKDIIELLTVHYPNRWSIEEFFNFEQALGWNNASTMNLNIKYGKQSLALLAQAATSRLKNNLPGEYKNYTAGSLSKHVLTNLEGDIRVKDEHIIITFYGDHEKLKLKENYSNIENQLINEGINPKIPWLLDYKLKFRFK